MARSAAPQAGQDPREVLTELLARARHDHALFARTFFPHTVRQRSPRFHADVWRLMSARGPRLVCIQVFRGGGKTTLARLYVAHRIAYGLSHTIVWVSKSEQHAARSVEWLRSAVEENREFARTFGVRPGSRWTGLELSVRSAALAARGWSECRVLSMGIGGSIRGVIVGDWRPDLILVDDVIDEENSATAEGRAKLAGLVLGALAESLAPASEAPDAKLVMLQTPLHAEDLSCQALKDPAWTCMVCPCWTPDTVDAPVDEQESAWPERWPSEVLRQEKRDAAAANRLSVWVREKECRLVAAEECAFRAEWLRRWPAEEHPPVSFTVYAIDPVPPPSDRQIAKGLHGKDYEAHIVVGVGPTGYYVLDAVQHRGHDPGWTRATFLRLAQRWRPRAVFVEAVAYQRVLAWLLRETQDAVRMWWPIREVADKRRKVNRIIDTLHGPAYEGRLWIPSTGLPDWEEQWVRYPQVPHDDLLDATALAVAGAQSVGLAADTAEGEGWPTGGEWSADVERALLPEGLPVP